MNTNDLNTALYEKMAAEQDKYRDWLKNQPPEEILNHTYEYTIREDIVMAMEELELTDAQAKALLESPSPLADVYRYFEKLETGYMDVIRDSIESRANEVCREPEELNPMVVYLHSASYATKHGETDAYWLSDQANFSWRQQSMGKDHSYDGGQRIVSPQCLSGSRPGQSGTCRPVYKTSSKDRPRERKRLCPAKAQTGAARP